MSICRVLPGFCSSSLSSNPDGRALSSESLSAGQKNVEKKRLNTSKPVTGLMSTANRDYNLYSHLFEIIVAVLEKESCKLDRRECVYLPTKALKHPERPGWCW